MTAKKRSRAQSKPNGLLPKVLILAGIIILVAVVFLVKNQPSQTAAPIGKSPETQLDGYLKEGRPVFAFFHSTDCKSCVEMMGIVDQVYPEFKDGVALVDVDVYDAQNENLLRRGAINSIPTLVFIDRTGAKKVSIGVMEADVLRQQLIALKEMP